ncbi:retrovirus-related pol polyprotein from transposon TNT 1-94 [Tanacetum coccineum]
MKKDIDEIETINIELERRVAKLISENDHLKQTYKQLYDSIKLSRLHAKEHSESLVNQFNQKFVQITDLNAQLQEKVLVITTLINDLRKLKGKDIVDNVAQVSNATTIAPRMYKVDPVPLAPMVKNNRESHIYYLKHTMEQAAILREIVEQAKSLNPLDSASYSTCKYVKLIQELQGYVRDTCPNNHKPSEKLVSVTPINMKKIVRITATNEVPIRKPIPLKVVAQDPVVTKVYTRRPKVPKTVGSNSKPKIAKSMSSKNGTRCSKHMTSDRSQLTNFIHKFLSTVKFGNDQIAKIWGYGDYQIDLEVAFRKHICFIRNLEGVDLLSGFRGTNLYSLSIGDMMVSSPICLLSKATKTKSWLWHRRLSHLNFGAINHLARQGLYILVIMDDCSRFTWVKFLASKDEAPDFIIKFLKMIQVRLNTTVRNIRTDNEIEFINQTLRDHYEEVDISHETSVARTPQQNGVIERRNCTFVEAARIMLIFAKAPLFLWVEAVATACYTQNRSLV